MWCDFHVNRADIDVDWHGFVGDNWACGSYDVEFDGLEVTQDP